MEALQAILTRRSIRKFTDQTISPEMIRQLLSAAMSAPSAMNLRPWHFVTLTERARLNDLAEKLPYGKMLSQAPLAVAICGDRKIQELDYWIQDCSAATQNLLLAAHALGLGAVWLGVTPRKERVQYLKEFLGLPEHVEPLCVVAVGWPAEEKPAPERYDPERIHAEGW